MKGHSVEILLCMPLLLLLNTPRFDQKFILFVYLKNSTTRPTLGTFISFSFIYILFFWVGELHTYTLTGLISSTSSRWDTISSISGSSRVNFKYSWPGPLLNKLERKQKSSKEL